MSLPPPEARPLPTDIVLVAYPAASGLAGLQGSNDGFFVIRAAPQLITAGPVPQPWLTVFPPIALGTGASRVGYRAGANPGPSRCQPVTFNVGRQAYDVRFTQAGGELAQLEMVRLLNSPLNLDFLVAITYVASLIRKVEPPPLKLLVIIVAILAIVALGITIALARHTIVAVPEPPPLLTDTRGVPVTVFPGLELPPGVLPLPRVAVEDQVIALQTVRQLYWLLRQVE